VPVGDAFTRVIAIWGRRWQRGEFCPTIDPTIPSLWVAGRGGPSRPSSHSPRLTCESRTRCDSRGPTAKSGNALLIPRWRDRDSHGPPAKTSSSAA